MGIVEFTIVMSNDSVIHTNDDKNDKSTTNGYLALNVFCVHYSMISDVQISVIYVSDESLQPP